jgi:hypothetical protein
MSKWHTILNYSWSEFDYAAVKVWKKWKQELLICDFRVLSKYPFVFGLSFWAVLGHLFPISISSPSGCNYLL